MLEDPTVNSTKTKVLSWIILLIISLIWGVTIHFAYRELLLRDRVSEDETAY